MECFFVVVGCFCFCGVFLFLWGVFVSLGCLCLCTRVSLVNGLCKCLFLSLCFGRLFCVSRLGVFMFVVSVCVVTCVACFWFSCALLVSELFCIGFKCLP